MSENRSIVASFDLTAQENDSDYLSSSLRSEIWRSRPKADHQLLLTVLQNYLAQASWEAIQIKELSQRVGLSAEEMYDFVRRNAQASPGFNGFRATPRFFAEEFVCLFPTGTRFGLSTGSEVAIGEYSIIDITSSTARFAASNPVKILQLDFLVKVEPDNQNLEIYSDQSMVVEWLMGLRLFPGLEGLQEELVGHSFSIETDPKDLLGRQRIELAGKWSDYVIAMPFD